MSHQMSTYRRADGEMIAGEYGWVSDIEYLEDEADGADYLEVVHETWVCVDRKTVVLGDLSRWCAECDADIELTVPVKGLVYCPEHSKEAPK